MVTVSCICADEGTVGEKILRSIAKTCGNELPCRLNVTYFGDTFSLTLYLGKPMERSEHTLRILEMESAEGQPSVLKASQEDGWRVVRVSANLPDQWVAFFAELIQFAYVVGINSPLIENSVRERHGIPLLPVPVYKDPAASCGQCEPLNGRP